MGNTLVDQDGSCRDKKSSGSIVSFLILYCELERFKARHSSRCYKRICIQATSEVTKEIVAIKKFIYELRVITSIADAIELRCDNNGAFAETKEPKISSKIQTYSKALPSHPMRCGNIKV
ncbi:hypothetical protein V6N12_012874 [Hibiscus sabdariffa]|uniref:Uncharacterized protein n=1 Tax=Hibiscus sabdariffa TaxID=183260 RepID=A0ABR2EG36_9ROSI